MAEYSKTLSQAEETRRLARLAERMDEAHLVKVLGLAERLDDDSLEMLLRIIGERRDEEALRRRFIQLSRYGVWFLAAVGSFAAFRSDAADLLKWISQWFAPQK